MSSVSQKIKKYVKDMFPNKQKISGISDIDPEGYLYKSLSFSVNPIKTEETYPSGKSVETWTIGSVYHKEDGPALVWRYSGGNKEYEAWFSRGLRHREGDAPQSVTYRSNGSLLVQTWAKNGEYHREDGPAVISYNEDGTVNVEHYYINGKQYRSKYSYEKAKKNAVV